MIKASNLHVKRNAIGGYRIRGTVDSIIISVYLQPTRTWLEWREGNMVQAMDFFDTAYGSSNEFISVKAEGFTYILYPEHLIAYEISGDDFVAIYPTIDSTKLKISNKNTGAMPSGEPSLVNLTSFELACKILKRDMRD